MIGDIIIVKEEHRRAARAIVSRLMPSIDSLNVRYTISIGGESGSGKSELASAIQDVFNQAGKKCIVLQQDDYFVYPPKTNAKMRDQDINHVGITEVRLDLLDEHVRKFKERQPRITKPLVIYQEDRIVDEDIDFEDTQILIVEGTYTTLLQNTDYRIFIDRIYLETKKDRLARDRESNDDRLENILAIEHTIISKHKALADLIVQRDFSIKES